METLQECHCIVVDHHNLLLLLLVTSKDLHCLLHIVFINSNMLDHCFIEKISKHKRLCFKGFKVIIKDIIIRVVYSIYKALCFTFLTIANTTLTFPLCSWEKKYMKRWTNLSKIKDEISVFYKLHNHLQKQNAI